MAVKSKKIRTQGDFDKEMNALQNEVRNIVTQSSKERKFYK